MQGGSARLTFQVKNNTNQTLLLDYALATIRHGPDDMDDVINFSGPNGAAGLVSAPTFILAGSTGSFVYSVITTMADGSPDPNLEGRLDFGVDPFGFSIEMSPFAGNPNNLPNPNDIFVAVAHGFYLDLTPVGTTPNAAGCDPCNPTATAGASVYPTLNPIIGLSTTDDSSPAVTRVTVFDTPEPATWITVGLAIVVCAAFRQRFAAFSRY